MKTHRMPQKSFYGFWDVLDRSCEFIVRCSMLWGEVGLTGGWEKVFAHFVGGKFQCGMNYYCRITSCCEWILRFS
jgi:hypothetical protein